MNISSKIARFLVPEGIPGFAARLYDLAARTAVERYFKQVAAEIANSIDSGIILDVGIVILRTKTVAFGVTSPCIIF